MKNLINSSADKFSYTHHHHPAKEKKKQTNQHFQYSV